jgi:preprotein translocase subunit SecD
MNKYPIWKYLLLITVLAGSLIYALPNLYEPDPAVQISGQSGATEILPRTLEIVQHSLDEAGITYFGGVVSEDAKSALIRLETMSDQLLAKSAIQRALGSDYVVALNLAPTTPQWLQDLGAQPMKLGLDLSGGVHFLMEVDINAAVDANLESISGQIRTLLREERIRYLSPEVTDDQALSVSFRSAEDRDTALNVISEAQTTLIYETVDDNRYFNLLIRYPEVEVRDIEERALQQNLTALKNRVNELGVAEPLVQRQGRNRIVVELPGIQDTAEAKRIIGKTANLEFRLEYDQTESNFFEEFEFRDETVGIGTARLDRQPIVTGESVTDASTGFDENGMPQVSINLSSDGGAQMHRATRNNIGRRMGVLFIEYRNDVEYVTDENGNEVAVTEQVADKKIINLATIQGALGVSFRITGVGSQYEAQELALLLRAGALAAPMTFVEERTVGPSLGAENIEAGVTSVQIGLMLVMVFMLLYYRLFGLFANISLIANLIILTAAMSTIGATLTLPGIAGIVLTLGMAVDANVLIFARIREELRNGVPPQSAISAGFDRAWTTILDANLTTLIVAAILYLIGSGAVQGFAVTLFFGILTSMFTAVIGTRAMVNLTYGSRTRIQKLWI